MKRSTRYGERDYAFGQVMLTLRMSIGLTRVGLADLLGVSRRAVGDWEAGLSYPTAEHLKQLIALGVQQQAFPDGREAEEIRALWIAAHQKVLLDERWLAALLGRPRPALTLPPLAPIEEPRPDDVPEPALGRRVDWGDALDVPIFYRRAWVVATLEQWVVEEHFRALDLAFLVLSFLCLLPMCDNIALFEQNIQ